MERLEHGDREALGRQQIGVDKTRGTGTDHRNRRLLGLRPGVDHPGKPLLGGPANQLLALRQVPFELADFDRPLCLFAHALALQFLRADAAGHVRQRIAALDQFERLAEFPIPQEIDDFGNVNFDRATALRILLALDVDAEFARAVVALLVAQHFEPHEHFHFTLGVAERHVAEIAGIHEFEVVRALLGRADVGRDVGIGRPTLRKPLEHRVAAGEMIVDRLDEFALELERHRPDEAHQDQAHIVVTQEQFPKHLGEACAEFLLLELPGDSADAIGHEGAA